MDENRAGGRDTSDDDPRLHPLTRTGLFLGLFLLVQVLVSVPAMLIWTVLTQASPDAFAERSVPVSALLFLYVCMAPVMVPATVVVLRKLDHRPLASIGVRLPAGGLGGALRQAGAGAGAAVAALALWLALVGMIGGLRAGGLGGPFWDGPRWLAGGAGAAVVLVLYLVGFAIETGLEEWLFRGYAYRALRERWSWATVAGATSVGFGALHLWNPHVGLAGLVNTFLLGFAFAAAVEACGTLWPAIAAHGAWNFTMAVVLGLPVSGNTVDGVLDLSVTGPAWLTGGSYGPEGSWMLTALLVPAIVALALWVDRRDRQDRQDRGDGQRASADSSSGVLR